jgi:kinesin family member C2/C3
MFVHISPEFDAIGESLSTLKFAERVAAVELGAARMNKDSTEVKELKELVQLSNYLLSKRKPSDYQCLL